MEALRRGGGELIPIDSEHSAILQCLAGIERDAVQRLVLTASGRTVPRLVCSRSRQRDAGAGAAASDVEMGAKITIDSATLANKALEVIEAHFLFDMPYDRIEAVVHPQSIIHSMVETTDGSVLAQLGFRPWSCRFCTHSRGRSVWPTRARDASIRSRRDSSPSSGSMTTASRCFLSGARQVEGTAPRLQRRQRGRGRRISRRTHPVRWHRRDRRACARAA